MNSRDYWAKREAEALKHRITDEAEYDREIKKIYQNMLDACQKEIDSFYAKYAGAEGITIAEAKKRVSQHDVKAFERKAEKYVKDKDFSKKANEELRLYNATMRINRLEMLKANIGLETIAGHDELEKFMGGILKGRTEDELKRQAGILGKTVRNNAAKANAIVNGSFHNGTFSDRIWQYQDLMREDLGRLLQQGLIQGKGARAIAKDLKKYWFGNDPKTGGGATYCMERLMRTELARVQTEAQKQSFIRNGFDMYQFICNHHASKHGTCDICKGLDGKHFKVADMMPGTNAPPMHPHCRCSTAAYEDSAEYEAWLDHLANGGTTEEWEKQKQGATINAPAKAEFTPAKTIEEAEAFAKQFAEEVDFGKLSVNACNSINETLAGLAEKYGVKLPRLGTYSKGNGAAHASYRQVEFKPGYFNSPKKLLTNYAAIKAENKRNIESARETLRTRKLGKQFVSKMESYIQSLEKKNLYNRWGVVDSYPSKAVKVTATHEFGHFLADIFCGQINGEKAWKDNGRLMYSAVAQPKQLSIRNAYKKAASSGDIYKISAYGATNAHEFFAEVFTMREMGEELPDYIAEMLEEVLK